jgi:histidine triad (HIT) family protein
MQGAGPRPSAAPPRVRGTGQGQDAQLRAHTAPPRARDQPATGPQPTDYDAPYQPTGQKERTRMAGEPQDDCLFCKIVAGQVPATIVRETETTVAFRDINPQAPTHILVIPKAHYKDAAALAAGAPHLAADVLRETQVIADEEKLGSYRTVFNTGSGAGQTVWHAHAHLLGGRGLQWPPG